ESIWSAVPARGAGRARGGGNRVWRMAAEPSRARNVREIPGYGSYTQATLRQSIAWDPDDPAVRGPCVRNSSGVGPLGGSGTVVSFRPGFPLCQKRRRNEDSARGSAG